MKLLAAGILVVSPVKAQDITSFNNIQLDGDTDETTNSVGIAGQTDWDVVWDDCVTNSDCSLLSTEAVGQVHVDDSGIDYTVFDGGIKDILPISDWTCNESPVEGKSDIQFAYGATFLEPTNPDDLLIFYSGADRGTNIGTANFGIWLFQNLVGCDSFPNAGASTAFTGAHADGDLLIIAEFDQGGSVSAINVYRWTDPTPLLPESGDECLGGAAVDCSEEGDTFVTGVNCADVFAGDQVCGITNDLVSIDADWRSGIPTNGFYETGFNLSELIGNNSSVCFATTMVETRSSTSLTASLKDFVILGLPTCSEGIFKDGFEVRPQPREATRM